MAIPNSWTTVVIPAYRAWSTLPEVLDALKSQIEDKPRDLIVVESSADGKAADLAGRYPWATVVALAERTLPGRARNLAVEMARGDFVAFLDADAVPSPGWLDGLEGAMSDSDDAVTSAVANGTPWHPVGTAGYLLEFVEWLPGRSDSPRHAPTCSLLVRKRVLLEAGGFAEDVFPGEDTIFTLPIASRGTLGYAPTEVRHINRRSPLEFLRHQVRLGASFVQVCDRTAFPHAGFTHGWRIAFAPALRLVALGLAVRRHPREAFQLAAFSPLIVLGLLFWTFGVAKARGQSGETT